MSANLSEMATGLSRLVWNRLLEISKDHEQVKALSQLVERRFTSESIKRICNRSDAWKIVHRGGCSSTSWTVIIYRRHERLEILISDIESKEDLLKAVKENEDYEKRQRMEADIALIAKFREVSERLKKLGAKRHAAASAEIAKRNGGGK